MSQIVPLRAVPSQQIQVLLAGQPCIISVYQQVFGLFVDLSVGAQPIQSGMIGQNLNRMVRDKYLGFVGDLTFFDLQGTDDPVYTGLGTRWLLVYLEDSELPTEEQ